MSSPAISRRTFLHQSGSCAAHLSLAAVLLPPALRARWPGRVVGRIVAEEPFGRLEQLAEGVWGLVSTPLGGDFTTVSNGGLIAGKQGVLAIEGFQKPEGATWLAGKARELTGRFPTHVLLTHYHSDHANGVAGYLEGGARPVVHSSDVTRALVLERNKPADDPRSRALAEAVPIDPAGPATLDLGGTVVRIVPRSGHTASDVSVELDDPSLVFSGDLVWNGMFPNFMDAAPLTLGTSVRALRRSGNVVYLPGHGPVATPADFDRYVAMLDDVERAARSAHERGQTAAEAAAAYKIPASLGEWTLFSPRFPEGAFTAWYRDLNK
ncbi:MAG: MBL fold metallo-hydrolase [Gemmatimonadota bacterium]